jgi:hypothetical protein
VYRQDSGEPRSARAQLASFSARVLAAGPAAGTAATVSAFTSDSTAAKTRDRAGQAWRPGGLRGGNSPGPAASPAPRDSSG